mmetsp:Transcript_41650/g.66150  ORF Transcript_41650/g.66150 Transcript_41650/m.66150 type:complete len:117 (+) Transcript_41650:109-459(+)
MGLKYVAAYLMSVLAGNENPTADDIKKILESVESEFDAELAGNLVSELEGKTVHEVIAAGKEKLKGFGGGGGGGGGGGAVAASSGGGGATADAPKAEKKVEAEEEEEEDVDFDLFG